MAIPSNPVWRLPDCLAPAGDDALPIHAVRPDGLAAFLTGLPDAQALFLSSGGFTAAAHQLHLLPGPDGVAGAVLGLGGDRSPHAYGTLPFALPAGDWGLASVPAGGADIGAAVLGFCLGAYAQPGRPPDRAPARLVLPEDGALPAIAAASATWAARDLINTPANLLGPAELAGAAQALANRHGADCRLVAGDALADAYPAIAAVGAGSDRKPVVAVLRWTGPDAPADAPLVSLCGKGVCFDTGGYDLKPSAGMLRMKKDMGGAAIALGLAHMVMAACLPVRLAVRIGCAENSVSGGAMRPLDVIRTRRGLSVEVGNTDAEGRLVLCDLLAEASDEDPALLFDFATLTGAARVALGPELPALFSNDDRLATVLADCGMAHHDPVWRLPLWNGYDPWLKSTGADLSNVSGKPFAGAIVGALFLRRFVKAGVRWAHLDTYAWNDSASAGRPEGGEAQSMRAAFAAILQMVHAPATADTGPVAQLGWEADRF